MNFLIDSYAPYYVDGGLLDKVGQAINWLFVDLPFFVLRMFTSSVLIMQTLFDQSDSFMEKRQSAYELSLLVLKNFGGTDFAKGSLFALIILLSAYYLLYSFFVSRKNFSKTLLHYLAVFFLFVFWFGSINTPAGTKSGSLFLIDSVSSVISGVKNSFTSSSTDFTTIDSEQAIDDTPLFNATIKQTFYYVNTGSLDGTMENGEKIDEKKLLMPNGLSKEEKKEFETARKEYIESIKDVNPYVQADLNKTMEKLMAIGTGGVNTMVTSYPALYVSAMLTVIQLIIVLLIILAPVFFIMSFVPACQPMLFKFFKLLMGVLFFPLILGVFLAVFFWANTVIDTVFMNAMKLVANPILVIMSGGIFVLTANVVLIIIKIFLYKSIWKNKYRLLSYFTDNQVEQPEVLQKVQEKADETKQRAKDMSVGGLEMAAGAYTGNQMLLMDGMNKMIPNDKGMNLGRYHFRDTSIDKPQEDVLEDWVENSDESESVEFVEREDSSIPEAGIDIQEIDKNLDPDSFKEILDEGLKDGITVDNLDEISLDSTNEVSELRELEQVQREIIIDGNSVELDQAFPEEIFFRDFVENEIQEEG